MARVGLAVNAGRNVDRRPVVVVLVLVLLALVVAVALHGRVAGQGGPPDEAALRARAEELKSRPPDPLPAEMQPLILLPEEQWAPWIAAWNQMKECAQRHGFDGVDPVSPSFGDGKTVGPGMHPTGPGDEAALAACTFDTSHLDQERVRAAVTESLRRH